MHELPVSQAMLKIALQHAEDAHAARITDIHVEVGELSSYIDDSIQFYWDILSRGTKAEGATLHFKRIPLVMACSHCDEHFHPNGQSFACPRCGSDKVKIIAGDGLNLVALDVENQEALLQEATQ